MRRSVGAAQGGVREVGVDLGGGQVGVAEQLLHGAQVGAALEQMRGERMAQGVGQVRGETPVASTQRSTIIRAPRAVSGPPRAFRKRPAVGAAAARREMRPPAGQVGAEAACAGSPKSSSRSFDALADDPQPASRQVERGRCVRPASSLMRMPVAYSSSSSAASRRARACARARQCSASSGAQRWPAPRPAARRR